ncbi:MAG: Trk system potassium transporter TrkA [Ignavibacteria bacterium]|jgi:trk system potassium uptake protein TrkA|nr:Trk system potassium transporter TrkA [Ignavibacteria bacterium]MDP3830896.1 Trk system potassium transporter TrkA [Ignavibacteriaceae bacterium]
MRIIIAGMGDVGFQLARRLSLESHDIIAIDPDQKRLQYTDSLSDILTINGSSTSIKILQKARVEDADLLLAVTSSEEVNFTTAILAKKMGTKKVVARVENSEYVAIDCPIDFSELGIDYVIYPEELAALETVKLIKRTAASDVIEFEGGKLTLIGLRIDKTAPLVNKTLIQMAQEYSAIDFRIIAIYRGIRTIIPNGKDKVLPNDQIFVIIKPDSMKSLISIAGKTNQKFENLMILGGSKIGRLTAKMLEGELNIKLIESDKDRGFELADELQNTLVINGDGRDIDLLAQEGIIDMDAFIAVTDDSETNIISCLMAKHLGVKKAIALVDKVDYIPLTQTIGLDALINKKMIAVNDISRFVRKGEVLTIASLHGIDAEVFEFICQPNSPATKAKIKDLNIPKDAIIGGIVRDDGSIITIGNTQIIAGDKVVVFALPGVIDKIEKLFS